MSAVKSTIKSVIKIFPIAAILVPSVAFAQIAKTIIVDATINALLGALGDLVSRSVGFVAYLIGMLASLMLTFGGALLTWAIELNSTVLSSPTVKTGFQITLNLANLGFVLAIIMIAFITILRWEKYETKQLIKNLVIAALLINFSLTIAGVFIDFTGVLSNFFVQKAAGDKISDFSAGLANAFGVQKFNKIIESGKIVDSIKDLQNFGSGLVSTIASVAFAALFTTLGAIAMLGTAFMVLIRYIYLTVLLILMPIAWLSFAFPNLSKLWTRWWDTFIKWTFFLPAATFFIYLAVLLVSNQSKETGSAVLIANESSKTLTGAQALQSGLSIDNPFAAFGQMIAVLGLLVGGLFAAQELGIQGAKGFAEAAGSVKKWTTGALKRGAMTPVRPIARGGAAALTSRYLRWIPGSTDLAGALSTAGSRKEEVAHYKKKLDALEGMALDNALSAPLSGNSMENTAMLQKAVETKKMDLLTQGLSPDGKEKKLTKLATHANANDPKLVKEILDSNPQLAGVFKGKTGAAADEEIKKAAAGIRADKWSDVDKDALANEIVIGAMNDAALGSLYRSGSAEKKAIVEAKLKTMAGIDEPTQTGIQNVENKIAITLKEIKEARQEGLKQVAEASQVELRGLRKTLKNLYVPANEDQGRAFEKLQSLKQRIGNPNIT